ncbi:selenocysteine-specific translation elongation factor [Litchfieldia alkalitelluris]|uniref:selenocysteine-specific translation elongation factor n=1 Tax=Litchfieldia alkalitelluris TaxID=304268 RepID=UPI0009960A17|nr:selenocysteine-specific translation elongation factor [Litchfieldia alkalitelluris]
MGKRNFTVGMAGHIDHGKTTLTKALTNIDTDRLKEEKERQISIELGFAPLHLSEDMDVSVIDVPGHERFIRQMIAGVAGIDLVVLVVAADEGVMPQTTEHLEILSFLGIERGIVAVTKIDRVDPEFIELVEDDIKEQLDGTVFSDAPLVLVDSLTGKGINELKDIIKSELETIETQKVEGSFRLPIDQVFTVKGQGTVVRGTIYEGIVKEESFLTVLPNQIEVKARQLQVHHAQVKEAQAGQRVAINLSGVSKSEITRGDVLVSSNDYAVTDTVDIALRFVNDLEYKVKQRSLIKCHIGTKEVMGTLVFFDRNEAGDDQGEILCQLRLNEGIVTKRGDRFILRRPTPAETIGGGWVIDPQGQKYRFGNETISMLNMKKEGTPKDRVLDALKRGHLLSIQELGKETGMSHEALTDILSQEEFTEVKKDRYSSMFIISKLGEQIEKEINGFHEENTLLPGMNKAELTQSFSKTYPKDLIDFTITLLITDQILKKDEQYISLIEFAPSFPKQWEKRMEGVVRSLEKDHLTVSSWSDYVGQAGLPEKEGNSLLHHLLLTEQIYQLDEKFYIHEKALNQSVLVMKEHTSDSFDIKEAKDILQLSRKYIVPLLELYDRLKITKRVDNERVWRSE